MFAILKIFSDAEVTSIIFSLYFFIDLEVRISNDQSFEIMGKITAKKMVSYNLKFSLSLKSLT